MPYRPRCGRPECPYRHPEAPEDEVELCHAKSLRSTPGSLEEALRMAHEQLGFHLLHRSEGHPTTDQDGGAAKVEGTPRPLIRTVGSSTMAAQEQGAGEGDAGQHPVEIRRRGRPGRMPGTKPPYFLRLVGLIDGVELHRGVEIREQDDQDNSAAMYHQELGQHPRQPLSQPQGTICAQVTGKSSTDEAKITGMTRPC